jgi:hypothetical protein
MAVENVDPSLVTDLNKLPPEVANPMIDVIGEENQNNFG